mmetsp:Transcript_52296/g.132140  ORF Transcript_52296/g.132140 Transcript_52296/m.132140 type:complete len:259 (-) Transcript_52296:442-1218(-)
MFRGSAASPMPLSTANFPAPLPRPPRRLAPLVLPRSKAALASRTGPMAASCNKVCKSEPEKPSVRRAIFVTSASLSSPLRPVFSLCLANCRVKSEVRAANPGNGTYNLLGRRRRAAWSSSHGMLVAPTNKTFSPAEVSAPSKLVRNSFFTLLEDSLSASRRWLRSESTSSTKITDGCLSTASWKSAFTVFSASPIHFDKTLEALMLKKVAPHSAAIHLASNVLPVPGGPNSSNPRAGRVSADANKWGWSLGRINTSSI